LPTLTNPYLAWSPNNSEGKLINLIASAKKSIDLEVENLGNLEIQDALIEAAHKNIQVRVLVPLCDKNINPFHNIRFIQALEDEKIQTRVMPSPSSAEKPYMHSKMILVDGQAIYIGSINFSNNSIQKARELGIIFRNEPIAAQIAAIYNKDWNVATALPEKRSRIQCAREMEGAL